MEIKINKEIREYTENMFFGLSLRQFIFSLLACGVAAGAYFLLKPYAGIETISWVCIICASPFAVMGFISYHGMTAEQFVAVWIKNVLLYPRKLAYYSNNIYYEALQERYLEMEKEVLKNND